MSDKLEIRGKTVKEAVSEALLQMGARRDEVEVTVLEEPKSGLFGFLGSRQAKVLVEKKSRRRGRRGDDYRQKDKDAIAHELGSGSGRGGRRGGRRNDQKESQQGGRQDKRQDKRQGRQQDKQQDKQQGKQQEEKQNQETRGRGRDENEQKKEEGSSRRRRGRRGGRSRRGRRSNQEQANQSQDQVQAQGAREPERNEQREPQGGRGRRNDRVDDSGRDEGRGDRNRRSRRSRRSRREDEQPAAAVAPVEEVNGNVEPEENVEVDGNRIDAEQEDTSRRNSRSRRGSRGGRRRSPRDEGDNGRTEVREGGESRNDRNDRDDRDGNGPRGSYDDQPEEMIAAGLKASQYAAAVRDVADEDLDDTIISLATGMLVRAGFPCRCEVKDGEYRQVRIVTGDDSAGMLIGRHGSTVDAVEHLVERMSGMASGDRVKMNLDINNYRRRREESLAGRVDEAVARVRETERDYHMEPMNARERRLIHLEAAEHDGIRTYTLMRSGEKHVVLALDRGEEDEIREDSRDETRDEDRVEAPVDTPDETADAAGTEADAEETPDEEPVEAAAEAMAGAPDETPAETPAATPDEASTETPTIETEVRMDVSVDETQESAEEDEKKSGPRD